MAVDVRLDPMAPRLTQIIEPLDGVSLRLGWSTTLGALATDPTSYISKVEFYSDGALLGKATYSPYTIRWVPDTLGSHQIVAKAYNDQGMVTASAPVTVAVFALPTVSITQPVNGTRYLPGNTINVVLAPQTPGSSVQSLSLTAYGRDHRFSFDLTSAPYSVAWIDVPEDDYELTAVVTNAQGVTAQARSYVYVRPPPEPAPVVRLTLPQTARWS